ncbi:MAG: hypothetical protein AB7P04_08230 [Bacteriovoracia bacterium]
MPTNTRKRTRLFMFHKFQHWFIVSFTLYSAVFLMILGGALALWFNLIVRELLRVSGVLSATFTAQIENSMTKGAWFIAGVVVILIAIAAGQAILFSRRIAGPLFAITRHLEKCEEEGKLTPLHLRKNDILHEIEERFNGLVAKVNAESRPSATRRRGAK